MSRAIHGKSHEALKAFRKKSAALAVYWVYVSRMNNEGVTWPSVARIATDTGWSKDTCHEARTFLVSVQALERVEGYIRPAWRELKPQDRTRKVNLDKSEYYRPTGFVMLNGKKLPMLYNGADEASTIDAEEPADASGIRQSLTSDESGHQTPSDIKDHRTVLDSNLVLGSIEEHAANAEVAEPPADPALVVVPGRKRDLIFDEIALQSFDLAPGAVEKDDAPRVAMISNWIKKKYTGATEVTLKAFYTDYDTLNPGAARPRDLKKFKEHFIKFHQSAMAKKAADKKAEAKQESDMGLWEYERAIIEGRTA